MSGSRNQDWKQRERWERLRDKKEFLQDKNLKHASPLKTVMEPAEKKAILVEASAIDLSQVTIGYDPAEMILSPSQWEILKNYTYKFKQPDPPTKDEQIEELTRKVIQEHNRYESLLGCYHAIQRTLHFTRDQYEQMSVEWSKKTSEMQEELDRLRSLLNNREDLRIELDRDYSFEERYA